MTLQFHILYFEQSEVDCGLYGVSTALKDVHSFVTDLYKFASCFLRIWSGMKRISDIQSLNSSQVLKASYIWPWPHSLVYILPYWIIHILHRNPRPKTKFWLMWILNILLFPWHILFLESRIHPRLLSPKICPWNPLQQQPLPLAAAAHWRKLCPPVDTSLAAPTVLGLSAACSVSSNHLSFACLNFYKINANHAVPHPNEDASKVWSLFAADSIFCCRIFLILAMACFWLKSTRWPLSHL